VSARTSGDQPRACFEWCALPHAITSPNAHDDLPRLGNAKPPAGWIRTLAKTSGRKASRNICKSISTDWPT